MVEMFDTISARWVSRKEDAAYKRYEQRAACVGGKSVLKKIQFDGVAVERFHRLEKLSCDFVVMAVGCHLRLSRRERRASSATA